MDGALPNLTHVCMCLCMRVPVCICSKVTLGLGVEGRGGGGRTEARVGEASLPVLPRVEGVLSE